MWLTVLIVWIALSSFLFSYFYLRLENEAWPPTGTPPPLSRTSISVALAAVSAAVMAWAVRRPRYQWLGGAALALQVLDFARLGLDWQRHGYDSIVTITGGFLFGLMGSALIMNALVLFWGWRRLYAGRHSIAVPNTALYWFSTVAAWVVTLAALYLTPRLT
jgi:hypothetical protein